MNEKLPLTINIEYGNLKTMNLRVVDHNTVLVRTNPRFTKQDIMVFVQRKQAWIEKQLQQRTMEQAKKQHFYLLGTSYQVIPQVSSKNSIEITDNTIVIHHTASRKPMTVLQKELTALCQTVFAQRLAFCMNVFPKLPTPKLSIRSFRTRWGTCKVHGSEITLNAFLIHTPLTCIDYVIVHELMHFYYPDHQKGFHAGMKKAMPDYAKRRKLLREFEYLLKQ